MTTSKKNNIRRLLSLADWREFAVSFLSALAAALCSLCLMGAAAWLITSATLSPPLSALTLGITAVRASGIGRAVFRYGERWFSHRLALQSNIALQLCLFDRAAAEIPLRSNAIAQGSWLEQLTKDCSTLRDFYVHLLLPLVAALLSILTAILLFPLISWLSLLVPLSGAVHILLPVWKEKQLASLPAATASYRTLLLDRTAGHDELTAGGSWHFVLAELSQKADTLAARQYQEDRRINRTRLVLQLLDALLLTGILFCLTQAALQHAISFIELGGWLLVLLELQTICQPLAAASRTLYKSLSAASSFFSQTSHTKQPVKPQASKKESATALPLIEAKQLTFGYEPSLPILKNLSFAIPRGKHTAIVGDSGTGKTTLACLLCGCWPLDGGCLFLQGRDSRTLSSKAQRAFFAPALQGFYILPGTLREVFLHLHPGISDETIRHALHIVQLAHFFAKHRSGLDTQLAPDAANLSGGQRSRLLTALALVADAPVLLLDEPTAGLDKKTASALLANLLAELDAQQRTLLLFTHDSFALKQMKQIIRL